MVPTTLDRLLKSLRTGAPIANVHLSHRVAILLSFSHFSYRLEPFCFGVCALIKLIKKTICAAFPGQFPFGILREDSDVTGVAALENSAALAEFSVENRLEPFCLGLCKLTYKILWIVTWPMCQLKPPFGR